MPVPSLDAAKCAARHRDAEMGDHRPGLRQVDLILVVDSLGGRAERCATPGAVAGQRDVDDAVDLLGKRCRPTIGPVTGFAPRPLGIGRGRALGEGAA